MGRIQALLLPPPESAVRLTRSFESDIICQIKFESESGYRVYLSILVVSRMSPVGREPAMSCPLANKNNPARASHSGGGERAFGSCLCDHLTAIPPVADTG